MATTQNEVDDLVLEMVQAGSMLRAGKTINADMFPEFQTAITKLIEEAALEGRREGFEEGCKAATARPPSIVSIHDFPAKHSDFRPWNNKFGKDYKDWAGVPEELFNCTRCGVEWGVAVRSNITTCKLTQLQSNNEEVSNGEI